jgi:putative methyltransferase (TIGR04325 family)
MGKYGNVARNWLPPAVLQWIQSVRGGNVRYEGRFTSWEEAQRQSTGYDAEEILTKVLSATLDVKSGKAAYERDSVAFESIDHAWLVLSGLMWAAARHNGSLNVLDFGGSLGSAYFQNLPFLRTLSHVRWNIVEQPHYTQAGRKHLQDDTLFFYNTIAECLEATQPNVVLMSSVLQYIQDPKSIMADIAGARASAMIIDRTPFFSEPQDEIVVQRVPPTIYPASYPMRIFSKSQFMDKLQPHWNLLASALSPEGLTKSTAGTQFTFEGMLLESRQ